MHGARVGWSAILMLVVGCRQADAPPPPKPAPAKAAKAATDLTPIVGKAGPLELVPDDGGEGEALSIADYKHVYQGFNAKHPRANVVCIDHFPTGLSKSALAGINLNARDHIVSWVVDGDPTHGYTIVYDENANGDLRDDPRHPFTKIADGFEFVVRSTYQDPDTHAEFALFKRIRIKAGKLTLQDQTIRRGTIAVGGRPRAFTLLANGGDFHFPAALILLDLDGDGVAGPFDYDMVPPPAEAFYLFEKTLNVGDRSYDFTVDAAGDQLTLTPRATPAPPRATLAVGSPAPDLAATDLDGQPVKLSALRGHTVLLDFWTPGCGPCRKALPQLADVYRRHHAAGLELLSIADGERGEIVKTLHDLLGDRPAPGHEIIEPGGLFASYRVIEFPSYFIVDPAGNLVCSYCQLSDVIAKLDT
jgi:thiol-disulfide isomerase/thioredoxin